MAALIIVFFRILLVTRHLSRLLCQWMLQINNDQGTAEKMAALPQPFKSLS